MSLAPSTRFIFFIVAIFILLEQCYCSEIVNKSQDALLAEAQIKILLLTLLGLGLLILLGCLGCICCFFRIPQATPSTSDGLDVYAPRTQSIVWPTLPQETAHILELTFIHTAKVGCLCHNCRFASNSLCVENCGVIPQCA